MVSRGDELKRNGRIMPEEEQENSEEQDQYL